MLTKWYVAQMTSHQFPSGLQLHSVESFQAAQGFSPSCFADYLALVGKKEAGIPGIGITPKLARTLLKRQAAVNPPGLQKHAVNTVLVY